MRILALIFFVLFFKGISAQAPIEKLAQLKSIITSVNQDISFDGKLVFVSLWRGIDIESREMNKEAYRVYKIYENAKLKNGEKGTVFISVNLDDDAQSKILFVAKDGIDLNVVFSDSALIKFLESEFNLTNSQSNIVFDKTGEIKYINVSKDQIFSSLRNLITR